eukprot:jgi/Chrpa1/17258/Chrysochromulina_OHIO_Genome00024029-RA
MLVGFPKNRTLDSLPQSGSYQRAHTLDRKFLRRSDVSWEGDRGKLHLSSLYGAEVLQSKLVARDVGVLVDRLTNV